jgi:hypothetical protein
MEAAQPPDPLSAEAAASWSRPLASIRVRAPVRVSSLFVVSDFVVSTDAPVVCASCRA